MLGSLRCSATLSRRIGREVSRPRSDDSNSFNPWCFRTRCQPNGWENCMAIFPRERARSDAGVSLLDKGRRAAIAVGANRQRGVQSRQGSGSELDA
jgi:hypothetical protein